jgi:hypothetical protein
LMDHLIVNVHVYKSSKKLSFKRVGARDARTMNFFSYQANDWTPCVRSGARSDRCVLGSSRRTTGEEIGGGMGWNTRRRYPAGFYLRGEGRGFYSGSRGRVPCGPGTVSTRKTHYWTTSDQKNALTCTWM